MLATTITRGLSDPLPTQEERDQHMINHEPFRSWCEHCVRGRGRGQPHKSSDSSKNAIPIFVFDYLFITKNCEKITYSRAEYFALPESDREEIVMNVLVAKCCKTKAVFAHCVKQKGADEEGFAVECLRRDLQWLGHTRVILKSDNEKAIVALLSTTLKAQDRTA